MVFGLALILTACVNEEDKYKNELTRLIHAAEAGEPEAMYSVFVHIGQKGAKEGYKPGETDLAQYWLLKAGESNNWRAAEVLKLCYEKGCWGLPIDLEKSKHYAAVLEKYGPNSSYMDTPSKGN